MCLCCKHLPEGTSVVLYSIAVQCSLNSARTTHSISNVLVGISRM